MSDITISIEEYYRLLDKAGEKVKLEKEFCIEHAWKFTGGAWAACHELCSCSISVFVCERCGICDYGENDESLDMIRNCSERETLEYMDQEEEKLRGDDETKD